MAIVKLAPHLADLIQRYLAGESELSLSKRFKVNRGTIAAALRESGIARRNCSEAMYARMRSLPPEDRKKFSEKAHEAIRGSKRPYEELKKRAKRKELTRSRSGIGEIELRSMIEDRGLYFFHQTAVDIFNLDLSLFPLAVELSINSCDPLKRKHSADKRKIEYLTNHGWSVLYILIRSADLLGPNHADYVATYFKALSFDPSLVGEYRMIGRHAELKALIRPNGEHFP